MIEVCHIRKADDLDLLTDFIHDQSFELEKIEFNKVSSTLRIPFLKELSEEAEDVGGTFITKLRVPAFDFVLEIEEVEEVMLEDTENVGAYDMISVEYDPPSRCLRILTGVPLDFRIRVREVRIRLYRDAAPVSSKIIWTLRF